MRLTLFLLACLFSGPFFGQTTIPDFGEFTPAEIALKTCPFDTAAAAVVLFDVGQTSIDEENIHAFTAKYTRHRRIKILRREGFGQGTVIIPYYSEYSDESVRKAKAMIRLPDGTVKTIEKGQFFREKYNRSLSALKFTFPDLQPGAIIEFYYEKYSTYIQTLETWHFQDEIPTMLSRLNLIYTTHFNYIALRTGAVSPPVAKGGYLTYNMENVPALHDEPFVTTMDDYRMSVLFQMEAYAFPGISEKVLESWEAVAEALHNDANFGKYLRSNNGSEVRAAAAAAIAGTSDTLEQVKKLFHFVANSVKFNDFNRYSTSESSPDKVFKKKTGSSADINLLLVHLINELKVAKALPMLISTRDHGQMFQKHPFAHQFNYVLGYLVVGGEAVVLDAVNPLRPFNLAHRDAYNENGLVLDKKTAFWVQLPPQADGHLCNLNAALSADGMLKGHFDWTFFSFSALAERATLTEQADFEWWKKRLAEKSPGIALSNFKVENFKDPDLPLKVSLDFEMASEQTGELFYVQPVMFTEFMQNPFKQEKRGTPVSFATKYRVSIAVNLTLPDGYRLDDKPADANLALPEKGGAIQFFSKQEGNNVSAQAKFSLIKTAFAPIEYPTLQTFFDLWAQKTGNVLVIKKG